MTVSQAWCAFGLGSNLGDRHQSLQSAWEALHDIPGLQNLAAAPLYLSEPLDCPPGSPAFFNTVVEGRYTGDVRALFQATQSIEKRLGRVRTSLRHEARLVDIDLLMIEGVTAREPDLTLPHPRLGERLFVLRPLADLRPDLILPDHRPITRALDDLAPTQSVTHAPHHLSPPDRPSN